MNVVSVMMINSKLFSQAAWKAMLSIEQTLMGDPKITDEELRQAAIGYAKILLQRIGFQSVNDEDIEATEGLIEAAVKEFKLLVGPPPSPLAEAQTLSG